jgi:uncharacterized protein (TIGR02596 family)
MLLVLAIIAALTAFSIKVFTSVDRSAALNASADLVSDLLSEGREDAMQQNTTVEVRFYQVPTKQNPVPAYRALQLHWVKADATTPAIRPVLYLPSTVVIDPTAQHSSLIGSDPDTASTDPSDPNLNAQTRVFHFLSDGTTDLPAGSSWFLTLRADTGAGGTTLPANWASVTVDPVTGRTQIFRP